MDSPTSTASSDAPTASSNALTAAVKDVHLPTFSSTDAATWFVRAEIQFRLKNVSQDSRKADYVMAALPEGMFPRIAHFLRRLGAAPVSYNELKAHLLRECVPSPEERAARFLQLSRQPIGDQRPSTAFREMQTLLEIPESDGSFKTLDLLRVFWLHRLPDPIRHGITNFVDTSEDDLLKLSDALQCAATPALRPVYSASEVVTAPPTPAEDHVPLEDDPVAAASQFHSSSRPASSFSRRNGNKRFGSRNNVMYKHAANPQPPRGTAPTTAGDLCFYHSRFGRDARKCQQPCSWPKNV